MSDKFTPGPWELKKYEITAVGEFAILAHVYRPDGSTVEGEANARLIAAAPDLLEACRAWIKLFEDMERNSEIDDPVARKRRRFHAKCIRQTYSAIAKATE